jgi:hypothetical protein
MVLTDHCLNHMQRNGYSKMKKSWCFWMTPTYRPYIGLIAPISRFELNGSSPRGWTGTDLGLGLKLVVLPLNALMLKDNFAEGPSMQTVSGFKDIL